MKAIAWTQYGPPEVLQLTEVEKPAPKDNQLLIKVATTTVTAGDCELRSLKFPITLRLPIRLYFGLRKPKEGSILGQELSGEVESVGREVTRFKKGDQVFAAAGFALKTYAEYACLPESGAIALKPANMSYEEAAAVPVAGLEALHFIRKAAVQPGQKVLINGAGGSIGSFSVQLAKYFGAEVTAVDSAGKLDMLRAIGADQVIDYTREDFTQSGERYDVVIDVIGRSPFSRTIKSLKEHGRYLFVNPRFSQKIRGRWASMISGRQVIFGSASQKSEDLIYLRELIEAGKLTTIIDRRYPLAETAEAHRYAETGLKKGNLIITVAPG